MPDEQKPVKFGTAYHSLFVALAGPFSNEETRRMSKGGRDFCYVTARTVQNRFDDILGPENWRVSYREVDRGIVCTIGIRLPSGEWLDKDDAGGFAGMIEKTKGGQYETDDENDVKTGYSDAFKRTAVVWGVGRYLYRDGVPYYVAEAWNDPEFSRIEDRTPQQRQEGRSQAQGRRDGNGSDQGAPRNGRSLFAWAKDQEEKHGIELVKLMNTWASKMGYPERIVDFDQTQVAAAYKAAFKKIQSVKAAQESTELAMEN
jgi:hypothetical protein